MNHPAEHQSAPPFTVSISTDADVEPLEVVVYMDAGTDVEKVVRDAYRQFRDMAAEFGRDDIEIQPYDIVSVHDASGQMLPWNPSPRPPSVTLARKISQRVTDQNLAIVLKELVAIVACNSTDAAATSALAALDAVAPDLAQHVRVSPKSVLE